MSIYDNIKVVCVDVDGCLSDGTYQVSEDGSFAKTFYTRDFDALSQLLKKDIIVVIISTSHDDVILKQIERIKAQSSMAELWTKWEKDKKLIVINKSGNKKDRLNSLLVDMKLEWYNVAYMGDAENDIECMKEAGFAGCPSDAIEEVRKNVHYPSDFSGGKGAVYDFCINILKKKRG